jgi:fructokinase
MKKYDVTAIGELLIDFTENGVSAQGNPIMEANPGGAPCNVLAMLNRLGHKTAFIGKVGRDMFGDQLQAALEEVGIDTAGLKRDEEVHTTLAFVHTQPDGDREFSFYRNPGADMMLREEDLNAELIENSTIFHFGTLSMTHENCRKATQKAIDMAEKAGAILSFDPNLRENLWGSLDEAKEQILYGMKHCRILKISDNEIQWLTGEEDYDRGAAKLKEEFGIPLILVSLGKEGSLAFMNGQRVFVPAYNNPNTIETTGAGDTFCACILHYVLSHGWKDYSESELEEMLRFANGAASIVTTRKGALRVMPEQKEVEAYIRNA